MKTGNEFTGDLGKLHDVMEISEIDGNWVAGRVLNYKVSIKLFADPSDFGIDNGRCSKLTVATPDAGWEGVIYNYDRGLDVETPEGLKIVDMIRKALGELT